MRSIPMFGTDFLNKRQRFLFRLNRTAIADKTRTLFYKSILSRRRHGGILSHSDSPPLQNTVK